MLRDWWSELNLLWPVLCLTLIWLFVLTYKLVLQPAYQSGLSEIPAASPLAPLTPLWMRLRRYRGQEYRTIEAAFRKHGPIVRLGPQEVAINCIDGGIRTVYGQGYYKTVWYDHFINFGRRNTISTTGETHGPIRRRTSHLYSKSYLQRSSQLRAMLQSVLEERIAPMLSRHESAGTPIDMLECSIAYGVDMVTSFSFGIASSANLLENTEQRRWFVHKFLDYLEESNHFWLNEVPNLTKMLAKFGLDPIKPEYHSSKKELEDWCLSMVLSGEKVLNSRVPGEEIALKDKPVVLEQLLSSVAKEAKEGPKEGQKQLNSMYDQREEVASECLDHIMATREDFGITLSSVFYYISLHPECQARLQEEIRYLGTKELPTALELENLPYFNAMIKEALRLRPNPPSPSPRVTPDYTTALGPYENIPPRTSVFAFSRSLHRNEDVFPDTEIFKPERWMRPDKLETAEEREQNRKVDECEKWTWTFSSGRRMCLASNLALELIRMITAYVYLRYSTSIVDQSRYGIHDGFVDGTGGEQLMIKFERL